MSYVCRTCEAAVRVVAVTRDPFEGSDEKSQPLSTWAHVEPWTGDDHRPQPVWRQE